jgi:SAM-dependent methyltransferase
MIFTASRKIAVRRRMLARQKRPDAARFLFDDMAEDMAERIAFLCHRPDHALVVGDPAGGMADALRQSGCSVDHREPAAGFDEEHPFAADRYDLIASIGTLDTVNDLPGALLHYRAALKPGGLMLASFAGAGSLPVLRAAMLAADGDRPAPRLHPMVDVRAGGQLLQRAGFADPVVDSRSLEVSYPGLDRLIGDLRDQGLSNVLADAGPPLHRTALHRARTAFADAGDGARTLERFELLTLSGWKR